MTKTDLSKYYGITITDIWSESLPNKIKALVDFKKDPVPSSPFYNYQNIIARIVVDKLDDYSPYIDAFKMVKDLGIEPMLQICDSALDAKLTDDEYNAREEWMLENLSEYCRFVEIANEIGPSTDWMSGKELQRCKTSSKLWVGHEKIITYFWNYDFSAMSNYILSTATSSDHQMLSFYPRQIEDFYGVERFLMFSRDPSNVPVTGFSECGMEEFQGKKSQKMTGLVKRKAYAIGSPVMWWGEGPNEF